MDDTPEAPEALERRIAGLRQAVRRAVATGDRAGARVLRTRLRELEDSWDQAVMGTPARPPLVPVREQVHRALTLLGVPSAPKLIVSVHDAFFGGGLSSGRLTSLRRDEERSFRSAPYARPYHLCAALTADLLSPARGLLAVSTWPLERRVIGPYTPRADFLRAAVAIARAPAPESGARDTGAAVRLLWRFGANIPGCTAESDAAEILAAALAELAVHEERDAEQRRAGAERARRQLTDVERLYGTRLGRVTGAGREAR